MCTKDKKCFLSEVVGEGCDLKCPIDVKIKLTRYGNIVEKALMFLNNKEGIVIDNYVIMPNHIHLIIIIKGSESRINDTYRDINKAARSNETIPKIVSSLKRYTNKLCGNNIWQRGYYEHIVRDEREYRETYEYIENNPIRWEFDEYSDIWQKILKYVCKLQS